MLKYNKKKLKLEQNDMLDKMMVKRLKFRKEYISESIEKSRKNITDEELHKRFDKLSNSTTTFNCKKGKKELFDAKVYIKKKKKDVKILQQDCVKFEDLFVTEQNSILYTDPERKVIEVQADIYELLFNENETDQNNIKRPFTELISRSIVSDSDILNSNVYNYNNLKKIKYFRFKYDIVKQKLLEDPRISLVKLTKFYNERIPEDTVSREFIRKIINNEFSYKIFYLKNTFITSDEYSNELTIFLKKFIKLLCEKFDVVFTDESKFTSSHKKHIWLFNLINSFKQIPSENFGVNISYNLILSVIKNEIVYHELYEENNNSEVFTSYFERLIKHLNKKKIDLKNIYFYIDNSRIHHSRDFKRFILNTKNLKIIYSVRYTPEINLCEYIFSILKQFFYSNSFNSNLEFVEKISSLITELNDNKTKIHGCYNYVFQQIFKFLKYLKENKKII